jgi:UDPglucose 6-dehydrogenase
MRVAVYGLGHLGSVTAACAAAAGHHVTGLDPEPGVLAALEQGRPPLDEPGLALKLAAGRAAGRLSFASDPADALAKADVLWVTFDTPVDATDRADADFVRARLERLRPALAPGTLVLVSSQVPVGFTRALEESWSGRRASFACAPENLRLGRAIEDFERPERVVVGVRREEDRARIERLFAPFASRIEWMGVESAEMSKHAVNAFLATSVTFINELARLCEPLGADAKEVERALRTEPRIGARAYVSPGAAFAGGTLARDLRYLAGYGRDRGVDTSLVAGVLASNESHHRWLRERVAGLVPEGAGGVAAVLGLAYKPGTSSLRRSSALELCAWLHARGVDVHAHDPMVRALPEEERRVARLFGSAREALRGADVAILATEWPAYRELRAADFVESMRRPTVVDPGWFLAGTLAADPRITYVASGRPAARR